MNAQSLFSLWVLLAASSAASAQMGKREMDLYAEVRFRESAPAEGWLAPDLVLSDLEGRPQALSAFAGRYLVLIKAGFT